MDKTTQELKSLLQDPRVDRRPDPQVYIVKEETAPDVYEAIVSDDYILEKGYHYKLIAEDGTQTVALGDGESNFTEASISGGGSETTTVAWGDITGKPTTFAPIIGTTATTAKAGDWTPWEADIPALPASKITSGTFVIARIPTGTTATTVALGNHTHAFSAITGTATATQIPSLDAGKITTGTFALARVNSALTGYAIGTAGAVTATDTIMSAIAKLEARILALETPTP